AADPRHARLNGHALRGHLAHDTSVPGGAGTAWSLGALLARVLGDAVLRLREDLRRVRGLRVAFEWCGDEGWVLLPRGRVRSSGSRRAGPESRSRERRRHGF